MTAKADMVLGRLHWKSIRHYIRVKQAEGYNIDLIEEDHSWYTVDKRFTLVGDAKA